MAAESSYLSTDISYRLSARQAQTFLNARQWLIHFCANPSSAEILALEGYYLQQALGSKATVLLLERAGLQGLTEQEIVQGVALLRQLDEGVACDSQALEDAVLMAESQCFFAQHGSAPRRRFLELSRNYLRLSPTSLQRLNESEDEFLSEHLMLSPGANHGEAVSYLASNLFQRHKHGTEKSQRKKQ
ncbi:hypothetical protein [Motiliproteus sp.]|uniref:hypothetical protein n=1 Tax=Motiliproteus sp. TaxID=1898955 RepID=UPI003BABDAFB